MEQQSGKVAEEVKRSIGDLYIYKAGRWSSSFPIAYTYTDLYIAYTPTPGGGKKEIYNIGNERCFFPYMMQSIDIFVNNLDVYIFESYIYVI